MRPSLKAIGRMSFRAFKAPACLSTAVSARPQQALSTHHSICSSISRFGVNRSPVSILNSSASAGRALICSSSHLVAAAAAAAAPAVTEAPAAHQQASTISNNGKGGNSSAPTFQEAIKRLQDYWAAAGCVVWLPHNTEVGAGTMNPATFLRWALVSGGVWGITVYRGNSLNL